MICACQHKAALQEANRIEPLLTKHLAAMIVAAKTSIVLVLIKGGRERLEGEMGPGDTRLFGTDDEQPKAFAVIDIGLV